MGDKIGSIEYGKFADLVVLDQSPFEVAPTEIAEIEVVYAMMDGRFTHSPSDAHLVPEDDDLFLDTKEITPIAWHRDTLRPSEVKALHASLAFARRDCCGGGEQSAARN